MEIQLWREILDPYRQAVDELTVKFEHMIEEHHNAGLYCPIVQVSGRVKKISSILEKCQRKNVPMEELEEEARKLAAAKAERERKEAEEAARKRVAGAFGKGAQMGSKGDTEGEGIQGSPTGNAPSGATSGTGGYGSFNLGGRSLGEGGLPRPVYNVQDEGRVVVTITVNPAGHVIATSINRQTNTVNPALRKAAEDAAKKARFNAVSGLNNQTGTITYYFNLK